MKRQLPPRPNLDQLKNQARDLVKAYQLGDPEGIRRIAESHPRFAGLRESETWRHRFTLSSAQLVIAREYGFSSWPKLKEHVEAAKLETADPVEQFKKAFASDDAACVRQLLERHPELKAKINEPLFHFDSPAIVNARSRQMIDVLLAAGADLNAKSGWWAGGFGLLHGASREVAAYAIERGAVVDVHAAARLGMLEKLRELIAADREVVHARGGDGQTPLHFASSIEIAEYLLDHGADIDARDVDHESTPAQYMLDDRQDVARYLVRRGCKTDLLLAAALGDLDLVRRHLDADPRCIRVRASDEFFPMVNKKAGGTIYQWKLGFYASAHQVAKKFAHEDVSRLLLKRTPPEMKLIAACVLGDEAMARALRAAQPDLVAALSDADRREVALAARNNDATAVRLLLEAGLPVDVRGGPPDATPLHWAAWHGNLEMIHLLLRFKAPLEATDAGYHVTPLNWAIHGSENGWYRQTGNYTAVVEALLQAGAKLPDKVEGSEAVREVLRRHGVKEEGAGP